MTIYPPWTEAEDRLLWQLWEEDYEGWAVVTARLGRTQAACQLRLSKLRKKRRAAGACAPAPAPAPAPPAAAARPVVRPQELPPIAGSCRDGDIRLRIAERGLTAGVFGDPPDGRSALDQRKA